MDNENFLKEVGNRIAEKRKQLNLIQEQLAEQINVNPQMISYVELGKKAIRPENLYKISNALRVSTDYILSGKITENDISYIYSQLNTLPPKKIKYVQNIIENCINLGTE